MVRNATNSEEKPGPKRPRNNHNTRPGGNDGRKELTMEKRYVVVDMPTGGLSGDIFQEVYLTPEEANSAADYKWHMLTHPRNAAAATLWPVW